VADRLDVVAIGVQYERAEVGRMVFLADAGLAVVAAARREPLFVSNRGDRLSRDAVERIVSKHVASASKSCPTLKGKRVTPHVLRQSAAMQLLQNGLDRTVIALWLEHESVESAQMYVHADIQLKEKAMAKPSPLRPRRSIPAK
jgi:site-specific recombinase XerD